jgi:hypothetical protein
MLGCGPCLEFKNQRKLKKLIIITITIIIIIIIVKEKLEREENLKIKTHISGSSILLISFSISLPSFKTFFCLTS